MMCCTMTFLNQNKYFDNYTDLSDYQLGACIMQDSKPVAYNSMKLAGAQRSCTTMEKVLLAIVVVSCSNDIM